MTFTQKLLAAVLAAILGPAQAADFETSITLDAAKILSKDLLSGPNHQVDRNVVNDGFLNIYTINTPKGEVAAVSTAQLRKYVSEINAAARMEQVKGTKEFMAGMKEKAGGVVEGTKDLVTDPVDTVGGAVSGVGKLFGRAKENISGGSRSDAESSRMKDLIGYSKTRRDYAHEFGVDAYSRNPILKKALDDISWAGYSGSLTATAALMAVPGGAGAAVSVAGSSKLMNDVFRDMAPADLRIRNREKLAQMDVSPDVVDLYIGNSVYTPREQTLLVEALAAMPNTKARDSFVKYAVLSNDPDVAFFRQRQAQMYEAFNRTVEPIIAFVPLGQVSAGQTASGKLVFCAPLDYLLWTKGIANFAGVVTQEVSLAGVRERHVMVTGTFSPFARTSLEKMGWKLHEKAESLLAGAP
jgi:hypothetical protein